MPKEIYKKIFYSGSILFVLVYIVLPFFYPVNGHDAWIHLNWLDQFTHEFKNGNLYPRWMPESFFGMGAPSFYYYPPFVYWVSSIISLVAPLSSEAIYHIVSVSSAVVSSLLFYVYMRTIRTGKGESLMAAVLYLIAPYRFFDVFVRSAFTEQFALLFLPLLFIAVELSIRDERKWRSLFIFALAWGGLLLSNVPVAVLMIYCVPIYWIVRSPQLSIKTALALFSGALMGLLISAVYLLPAYELLDAVRINELWDIFTRNTITGNSFLDIGGRGGVVFLTGMQLLTILGFALVGFLIATRKKWRSQTQTKKIVNAGLAIAIFAQVFQIPKTRLLFDAMPLLKLLQVPFRLNIIFALVFPMVLHFIWKTNERFVKVLLYGYFLLAVAIGVGSFVSYGGHDTDPFRETGRHDAPEYVTKYATGIPKEVEGRMAQYQFEPLITSSEDVGDSLAGIHIISEATREIRFASSLEKEERTIIRKQYFPLWKLTDETGKNYSLSSDSSTRIFAMLPAGEHSFRLQLEEARTELAGKILSLSGLILLLAFGILAVLKRATNSSQKQ